MVKVFVQISKAHKFLDKHFARIAEKHYGEALGIAKNDGRLLFSFTKKRQARKFTAELLKYKCWFQIAS